MYEHCGCRNYGECRNYGGCQDTPTIAALTAEHDEGRAMITTRSSG